MSSVSSLPSSLNGSMLRPMVGAVIYVRVSDPRQAKNLSLGTQLSTCEDDCRREGFEVLHRFKEEGESAKTADRTELLKLLTFCRKNRRAGIRRAVRQRRALGPHPRRHDGRTEDGALDVSGAARILERATLGRSKLDPRSGAGPAHSASVRGSRERTFHRERDPDEHHAAGASKSSGSPTLVAEVRGDAS